METDLDVDSNRNKFVDSIIESNCSSEALFIDCNLFVLMYDWFFKN